MSEADGSQADRERPRRRGVVHYAAAWLGAGALIAGGLLILLPADDSVRLPPVRQIELKHAARTAGCELRRGRSEGSNPPSRGPAGVPLGAGVYDRPQAQPSIVAALRRGTVVIQYRSGLAADRVTLLREVQRAVPRGTIVAQSPPPPRYDVTAMAWGRLLACRRFTDRSLDAIRLFRGRYIGLGPESPP